MDTNATTNNDLPSDSAGATTLTRLPDAQVFSRDPEAYTPADLADTVERLQRILARQRKARADDADVAAKAATIKKTNAAAKRAKARAKVAADPMDTTI